MIKVKRGAIILLILIAILTLMQIMVFSQQEKPVAPPEIGSTIQLENESGVKLANLTLIEHTYTCLTNCRSIIEFIPLLDFTYDFDTVTGYYVNLTGSNGIKNLAYNLYKKVELIRSIDTYSPVCTNITNVNGTIEMCNIEKSGYYNETYSDYQLISFNGMKTFQQGEEYKIVVEISRMPKLGPNYIDWILNFNGFEVPWAVVGSNYTYFRRINFTDYGLTNMPFLLNETGFIIDGNRKGNTTQYVWGLAPNQSSMLIYYNNESDYALALNETTETQIPMEVAYGNGTNYTNRDVWDENYTLVLHFDENKSGFFIDSSKYNRRPATSISNMTSSGRAGNAYNYDATFTGISYPLVGQSSSLESDDFTIEAWIRNDNNDTSPQKSIASIRDISDNFRLNFVYTPTTQLLEFSGYNAVGQYDTSVNLVMGIGQWHYLVVTYDNNGSINLYVDGVDQNNSWSNGTQTLRITNNVLCIAGQSNMATNATGCEAVGSLMQGYSLDEVRISNISRSAEYIRAIYSQLNNSFGVQETQNDKPNTPDVSYNVSVAYNFTNLNCSTATGISDQDGDNMTVFFNLTIDSLHKEEYILTNQPNGSIPSWQIDHHNYSKGQAVRCNITLFDGLLYSVTNSTNITISNAPPSIDSFNASSLNRSLISENKTNVTYQENETVRFSVNISDLDTSDNHWYSWFVNDVLKEFSQNRFFDWAFGLFSDGLNTIKVVITDSSDTNITIWNVTILNVVNRFFTVDFISPPTPSNGSTLDSTTVNISVQIFPPIQSVPKTFIDDTEAEFNLGNYLNLTFNTSASAIALNKTVLLEQIFFDGFESGNLNNWSITGAGNVWNATVNNSFEGWSAKVNNTGTGSPTNLNRNISTIGFTSINVNYYRQLILMDAAADEFHAEYYNGVQFTVLELNDTIANDASYVFKSFNLSADANENPNFGIRFVCRNNAVDEQCRVDNVKINGTRQFFLNNGVFISQIFNASENIIWDNISWVRILSSETNLTFQARSCDDSLCSGESFIGHDGTADTFYANYLGQNLNVSNNTYLQYKAFFSTTNVNVTPQLSAVTIKGHTIVAPTPIVEINSSYIDFNGSNITMIGSGFFWNYVNTTLRPGNYSYIVYVNDSFNNINFTEKRTFNVPAYNITFNVTSGEDGSPRPNVTINCNYSGFAQGGDDSNPYGPYIFPPGNWQCTFVLDGFYNKIVTFTADITKTVSVEMEFQRELTIQEHDWLRDLYNCVIHGQCTAYQYWEGTNQNVSKIWNEFLPTNRNVVAQESFLSSTLSSSQNISINYTLNIPFKEGYNNGELLPIRIFFWFTDLDKTKCFSQDKQADSNRAESPYCIPLIAYILGPNNGTRTFIIDLRPNLPNGQYNVTRSIDIDPIENNEPIWINYGREVIGGVSVLEDLVGILNQQDRERIEARGLNGLSSITGDTVKDIALNNVFEFFALFKTEIFILLLVGMICITLTKYFKYKY